MSTNPPFSYEEHKTLRESLRGLHRFIISHTSDLPLPAEQDDILPALVKLLDYQVQFASPAIYHMHGPAYSLYEEMAMMTSFLVKYVSFFTWTSPTRKGQKPESHFSPYKCP